jgi:hypothetical protein
MTGPAPTDPAIAQGRALVQAIEALYSIELSRPFEREVADLLRAAYKRRLMEIIEGAPSWVADEILSASEHIGDRDIVR